MKRDETKGGKSKRDRWHFVALPRRHSWPGVASVLHADIYIKSSYIHCCKASTCCGLGTEQIRPRDACPSAATTPCSKSSPHHSPLRIALFPLSIPHLSPSDRRLPSNSQDSALVASTFTLGSPKTDGRLTASASKGSRRSQPPLVEAWFGIPSPF